MTLSVGYLRYSVKAGARETRLSPPNPSRGRLRWADKARSRGRARRTSQPLGSFSPARSGTSAATRRRP